MDSFRRFDYTKICIEGGSSLVSHSLDPSSQQNLTYDQKSLRITTDMWQEAPS